MATPLLTTKLYVPPARPDRVERPRLLERLDAGLSRKLTLVSAPPGFGKTTLLSEWIANCKSPFAIRHTSWITWSKRRNRKCVT